VFLILIFFTSLGVAFSGAAVPGPLFTMTVAETARRGFVAGPLLIAGHAILELVLVVALVLGFKEVLDSTLVLGAVGLLGGGFLVFMGLDITTKAIRGGFSLNLKIDASKGTMNPVIAGIITSLSNPYWTLWWAGIGAGYVFTSLARGVPGLAAFFLGHISGDLIWYGLIAFAVVSGKRFLSDRAYQIILVVCGLFLLVLAVYFLYRGANALEII
jgi:threonine/homoserine/homoserine lactone efflux protein